jgi:hypothetical protein
MIKCVHIFNNAINKILLNALKYQMWVQMLAYLADIFKSVALEEIY